MHTAYVSLASGKGDRQANILRALQHIRTRAEIGAVSSYYEVTAPGFAGQAGCYVTVCRIRTDLTPQALLTLAQRIEKRMDQGQSGQDAAAPIAIDILLYDDLAKTDAAPVIPHPELHKRAFVLTPLVEIAPDICHPGLRERMERLLAGLPDQKVTKLALTPSLGVDVQQGKPAVPLGLSRVGVTNQERNIQLLNKGHPVLFSAQLDLFADLASDQAGVHMSRFGDAVEDLIQQMTREPAPSIESLAGKLARSVMSVQGALRSEAHIRARAPLQKTTPISGKTSEDLYTLLAIASATHDRTRCLVGVETEGMTACPCAQDMVREYSSGRLKAEGFSASEVERILAAIPIASHNQRGRGTLLVGAPAPRVWIRAENLVHLVEMAMSSETYAILKRPDELFVVNKAHRQPRFAEDVVREMLLSLVDLFPDLPDETFVLAKQENLESIHKHNAFAERYGTLGELRRELSGKGQAAGHTSLEQWLKG